MIGLIEYFGSILIQGISKPMQVTEDTGRTLGYTV